MLARKPIHCERAETPRDEGKSLRRKSKLVNVSNLAQVVCARVLLSGQPFRTELDPAF
jgi:hypothetical protein